MLQVLDACVFVFTWSLILYIVCKIFKEIIKAEGMEFVSTMKIKTIFCLMVELFQLYFELVLQMNFKESSFHL